MAVPDAAIVEGFTAGTVVGIDVSVPVGCKPPDEDDECVGVVVVGVGVDVGVDDEPDPVSAPGTVTTRVAGVGVIAEPPSAEK